MIEEFGSLGFKFFRETIWSSSLQQSQLPKIRNFLSKNNFKHIDVSLVIPQDDKTFRMRWLRYYEPSGQCISSMQQVPIPAQTNHLKLTFCYATSEKRHESRTQTLVITNALRLVFGAPVARELILTRYFSEDKDAEMFSDEGYASVFDSQDLNMFENPPIDQAELIQTPEDAAILLDKSFSQTYPTERFILMWLAFESIIHSVIQNGKNGDKRKTFFKDILKSDIANNEVLRLFKLRCDLFKEGYSPNHNFEDNCFSLYVAIQLLIMKDCEQRSAFLEGYEYTLMNKSV